MNPKVHIFEDERQAYDMAQCRDDIKDGDVLLIPGVCAAVLYQAWPVFAAGIVRNHEVLHELMPGKTFRDLEDGEKYEESWVLAEHALFLYDHALAWAKGAFGRAEAYARWYVQEYTQYEPGDWPAHNWAWTRFLEEGGDPQS